jgi:aldose 1-epimerase
MKPTPTGLYLSYRVLMVMAVFQATWRCRYIITGPITIEYFGETDQTTFFNLTNHSYFNLSARRGNVFEHRLRIFADQVVKAGDDYIPTGEIVAVDDANSFCGDRVGEKLKHRDGKLVGVNICYVLDIERGAMHLPAAILLDPSSGRRLSVFTSYPGILLYTGDYLNTIDSGNHRHTYQPFEGLCLEAQFFPDSPNHLEFPSPILLTGTTAHHTIVFKCDTRSDIYEN